MLRIRGLLVLLSASCMAISISAYVYSFCGTSVEGIIGCGPLVFLFAVALSAPIYAREYPSSRAPDFFVYGFARKMPGWVSAWLAALLVFVVSHFVFCIMQYGGGVPSMLDGQYVINSPGHILKTLTVEQHLAFKELELRLLASMMLYFSFVPMTYWYFSRDSYQSLRRAARRSQSGIIMVARFHCASGRRR